MNVDDHKSSNEWDAIIVGGGPAGLSAALLLGRSLRKVLICDAGKPRNAPARIFNGFLSRDASDPREFLAICREQLQRYDTVEFRRGAVTAAERDGDRFRITVGDGSEFRSRLLLLASGLIDDLPQVDGLVELHGKTAHSCLYCDGFEHRGQPLAVLGASQEAAELALETRLWSSDVVLCSNASPEWEADIQEKLARKCVTVIEKPIRRLEGADGELTGVRFVDGSLLPRSAIFFSPGQSQRCELAEKLGCRFCDDSQCIESDENGKTHIPGLYASGNASGGVQLVIAAAAKGTAAAVAMNNELLERDA